VSQGCFGLDHIGIHYASCQFDCERNNGDWEIKEIASDIDLSAIQILLGSRACGYRKRTKHHATRLRVDVVTPKEKAHRGAPFVVFGRSSL
jgi:hypothetical protein